MCGFMVILGKNKNEIAPSFKHLTHRGPDDHQLIDFTAGAIGFHRLSIMDLSHHGRQPFTLISGNILVCNGEIYNYPQLKPECIGHQFISSSDCEVLLPLYERWGIQRLVESLDAEFALVLWDKKQNKIIAARDPMGIRPMFYGKDKNGKVVGFASEMKALIDLCAEVAPFPPGHFYDGDKFVSYLDYGITKTNSTQSMDEILTGIRTKLISGVEKRLQSDAEVGFLLSGGLDSSLVCAIAQKISKKPIRTFSIGMPHDAIDAKYAQEVATFIGAHHTNVTMTKEDVLATLKEVIWHLETWDITTVRASIGMYLVCKFIHEKTNIKVLLSGEVSDELFGYKYTDFAPNAKEFQDEAIKRIRELYMYDVLRADRCISAHSLEARVPFSDQSFVEFVMAIDPQKKMNTTGTGKFLLREAFKHEKLLPDSILWREKAAFSDAVGHSMVDELKAYAETKYSEQDVVNAKNKYPHGTPFTKESLLYRDLFESFYPGKAQTIKDFWMPNSSWKNCNVKDPSARVLPNYGGSGV